MTKSWYEDDYYPAAEWPLEPCSPSRRDDGQLGCRTHDSGYRHADTKSLQGWALPPEGTLCLKALTVLATVRAYEATR